MTVRTLPLDRPVASLDLETTGTSTQDDRIVEIAVVRCEPDGSQQTRSWFVNPERPIPPDATRVHGIGDEDVGWERTFAEIADEVAEALRGCDLVGYNLLRFDVPMLRAEFARAGRPWPCDDARIVDVFPIFKARNPHTLERAVALYLGRPHVGAHRAFHDAEATLDVLFALIDTHRDLPADVRALADLSASAGKPRDPSWATACGRLRWRDGQLVVGFGKHAGKPLASMDAGYLDWIRRGDFPDDVKALAARVARKEAVEPPARTEGSDV